MAVSSGRYSITVSDILSKTTEEEILLFYLNINKLPCIINSPLREDKHPSFGLYFNNNRIFYCDFATKEKGSLFDLLSKLWKKDFTDVLNKINEDITTIKANISNTSVKKLKHNIISLKDSNKNTKLQCKIRKWEEYDIEYWNSYGIPLVWLKYAEVYPISHKIIIKNNNKYVFKADKYAYVYVEHKEEHTTLKIYQPFNTSGYKWSNKHDNSVISLWTKVPEYGEKICICSSLKDALCLWSNIGIPAIAIQGEGYSISNTAIKELKRRYHYIYICLDNDKPGIEDAKKLADNTGFTNIILPKFDGGKDISDLYKLKGKEEFIYIMKSLFFNNNDLPFDV